MDYHSYELEHQVTEIERPSVQQRFQQRTTTSIKDYIKLEPHNNNNNNNNNNSNNYNNNKSNNNTTNNSTIPPSNNNNNNATTSCTSVSAVKSIDNICARLKLSVDKDTNLFEQDQRQQQQHQLQQQHQQQQHSYTTRDTVEDIHQPTPEATEMLFCNQQPQQQQQEQQYQRSEQQQQDSMLLDHDDVSNQSPINSEEGDSNIPDESETMSNEDDSYGHQGSAILVPQDGCEDSMHADSEKSELDPDRLQLHDNKGNFNNVNIRSSIQNNQQKLKPRNSTHYNSWHYKDMILAIKAVQTKNLSMTAAAKRYGIPRTTLRHYLNDGTNRESKRAGFCLPKPQENILVEYALQHRSLPEKQLYKYIFDRAKELSRELTSVKGEEERRIVPTPAWIRRFVYRQKRLHDLFPTLLSRLEHPLHGGRKSPANIDMSFDTISQERETISYDKVSTVASRRVSTEIIFPKKSPTEDQHHRYDVLPNNRAEMNGEPHVTYEISKSPSNGYENNNEFNSRSVAHSDDYDVSSDSSPPMKQLLPVPSAGVPRNTPSTQLLNNSMDKEILENEMADYWHHHHHHHNERSAKREKPSHYHHYHNHHAKQTSIDNEHSMMYCDEEGQRYKDQIPLLIDSNRMPSTESNEQTYYTKNFDNNSSRKYNSASIINSTGRYNSDENLCNNVDRRDMYEDRYTRPSSSSKSFNRTSPYMNGCVLPTSTNSSFHNIDSSQAQPQQQQKHHHHQQQQQLPTTKKRHHHSPLYSSDENISMHSPALQNGTLDIRPGMEARCLRKSLDAMEYELGSSYVNFFTKRYQENRKLERLYCKWVNLKGDLEKAEKIKELLHHGGGGVGHNTSYDRNLKGKVFYSHSP